MIDLTARRIGIYYKDREWAEECFDYLIEQIPKEYIGKITKSKSEMYCGLYNGDTIRAVRASENARGYKFTDIIMQEGLDDDAMFIRIMSHINVVRDKNALYMNYAPLTEEKKNIKP